MTDEQEKPDPDLVMGVFTDFFTRTSDDALTMTFDEWEVEYKPGALLSEGTDDEREQVESCDRRCLWSFCDDGDGGEFIANGVLLVNFIGHYITEVPYEECVPMMVTCDFDYGEDDDDDDELDAPRAEPSA